MKLMLDMVIFKICKLGKKVYLLNLKNIRMFLIKVNNFRKNNGNNYRN